MLVDSTNFTTLFGGTDSLMNILAELSLDEMSRKLEYFRKNFGTTQAQLNCCRAYWSFKSPHRRHQC